MEPREFELVVRSLRDNRLVELADDSSPKSVILMRNDPVVSSSNYCRKSVCKIDPIEVSTLS